MRTLSVILAVSASLGTVCVGLATVVIPTPANVLCCVGCSLATAAVWRNVN